MSTKIGMDDAIIQLKEMFPSVEEDVIGLVLTENSMPLNRSFVTRRRQYGEGYRFSLDPLWR